MARQLRDRHDDEPGFVLHTYPYRETSLIVEAFTPAFGRVSMVARGAKRPRSELRGLLNAFQPLALSWAGAGELKTLIKAEWRGGLPLPGGSALLCGFYLNELVLKLLQREDPHEQLYEGYERALAALRGELPPAWAVRRFEKDLLRELGYGLLLEHDVGGEPIQAHARYTYILEAGPRLLGEAEGDTPVELLGTTLIELAADDYRRPATLQESRALMRYVLTHYLGGQQLHTRQLLREMQQL